MQTGRKQEEKKTRRITRFVRTTLRQDLERDGLAPGLGRFGYMHITGNRLRRRKIRGEASGKAIYRREDKTSARVDVSGKRAS